MSLDDIYYAVFVEAERRYWYLRWLKKGFSHCYILRADGGKWLKYETGHGVTRVDVIARYEKPSKDCIMIKITARKATKWILFNTCVSLIKMITGRGGLAITPYQLYKRLTMGRIQTEIEHSPTGGGGILGKDTAKKIRDPLGIGKVFGGKKPKKQPKTAEQNAIEIRQRSLLDDEIEDSERKFKALRRGNLGRASLLSGANSASTSRQSAKAPSMLVGATTNFGG